ncbi:MAG: ABC transporter substrate-binding protein [Rhodospirillaceae bacterium]|nr:ABC transporter substrate-binding protein [Rhodospirillaceae bacterium]
MRRRRGATLRHWPALLMGLAALLGVAALAHGQETAGAAEAPRVIVSHALAQFAEPHYPADFTHFDYADPAAPRGGLLRIGWPGGFDTVNPLPLAGEEVRSHLLMLDPLMWQSQDELSVYYPLIAAQVEYPDDYSYVIFHLDPAARWQDGEPITADDVVWTFHMIEAHGRPFLRAQYSQVTGVEMLDEHRVRFDVSTRGTARPLQRLAELQPMPRHWWEEEGAGRDITRAWVDPMLGSGPYRLTQVRRGLRLRYERVEDYWADDLPVRVGQFNFDAIEYAYYRDRNIQFEAFRAGEADFRHEYTSRLWATGYDMPQVAAGLIRREEVPVHNYRGLQGYFFNTRLPMFADRRVRQALGLLYPFEFVNHRFMYDSYQRMDSYFAGADDWRASGLPEGRELELLEPFRDQVWPQVFEEVYTTPVNGERGVTRENYRLAIAMLAEAGWVVRDGVMVNAESGAPMEFEILLATSSLEPHTLAYTDALQQIGIHATVRTAETTEYTRRYQDRDFDLVSFAYTFFPPPGSELASYFGSAAADVAGSANIMGIADPAADAMIEAAIHAETLEEIEAATHALDRLLVWGYYAVPHWYKTTAWIAYWNRFGRPDIDPPYDFAYPNTIHFQPTWWIDPVLDAEVSAAR